MPFGQAKALYSEDARARARQARAGVHPASATVVFPHVPISPRSVEGFMPSAAARRRTEVETILPNRAVKRTDGSSLLVSEYSLVVPGM